MANKFIRKQNARAWEVVKVRATCQTGRNASIKANLWFEPTPATSSTALGDNIWEQFVDDEGTVKISSSVNARRESCVLDHFSIVSRIQETQLLTRGTGTDRFLHWHRKGRKDTHDYMHRPIANYRIDEHRPEKSSSLRRKSRAIRHVTRFRKLSRSRAVSVGGRVRVWIFHNSVLWFIATSVIFHRVAYEIKWLIAREKERRLSENVRERESEREREKQGERNRESGIYLSRSLSGWIVNLRLLIRERVTTLRATQRRS